MSDKWFRAASVGRDLATLIIRVECRDVKVATYMRDRIAEDLQRYGTVHLDVVLPSSTYEQHRVGEYVADYTLPTQAELHAPNPELDDLIKNSRVLEQPARQKCKRCNGERTKIVEITNHGERNELVRVRCDECSGTGEQTARKEG